MALLYRSVPGLFATDLFGPRAAGRRRHGSAHVMAVGDEQLELGRAAPGLDLAVIRAL